MIDFHDTWLPQIIGYAKLICSDDLVQSWVYKNRNITSVNNFDELYEQIFDDLDSENILNDMDSFLDANGNIYKFIFLFIRSLSSFNEDSGGNLLFEDPFYLLKSNQWDNVRKTAKNLLNEYYDDSCSN